MFELSYVNKDKGIEKISFSIFMKRTIQQL